MPAVIAHRGASARHLENTIEAFAAAVALGADMVELDVRRTADGALVVHHDAHLPGGPPIVALAARDLPPHVPLLDEALDTCGGIGVNIEVKNFPGEPDYDIEEFVATAVVARLEERSDGDRMLISSFNLATIDAARRASGGVATAFLTLAGWDQHQALSRAVEHGHDALHPQHDAVTPELVAAAHEAGLAINTWTVDDPERMRALAAMGVDGIVTNVPDVALATLDGRR